MVKVLESQVPPSVGGGGSEGNLTLPAPPAHSC